MSFTAAIAAACQAPMLFCLSHGFVLVALKCQGVCVSTDASNVSAKGKSMRHDSYLLVVLPACLTLCS